MSAAMIEKELEQYIENTGYQVAFRHANSYDWFYTYVIFEGVRVAEKSCCKSYGRSARWAKLRIKDHKRAIEILAGLTTPAAAA